MHFILATIVLISLPALADSFTMIRDGQEYLCQSTSSYDPEAPQRCAAKAYAGPFNRTESLELCTRARSEAPADCAIYAYNGPFSEVESIQICKMALSTSPAECAIKAYSGPFYKAQAVELCERFGTVAHADCAIRAYAGPYSKEEAIAMCRANPFHMMKALKHVPILPEKIKDFRNPQLLREGMTIIPW